MNPPRFVWQRRGLVLGRSADGPGAGEAGWSVVGDPCIVRDEALGGWRMVLFFDPPGHGEAICTVPNPLALGAWQLLGPLPLANPTAWAGGAMHKPWIVMDAHHPNEAARIGGRFCLLGVSFQGEQKVIQAAWAPELRGPWTVESAPLLLPGAPEEFDAKHADAVTAFHFPERGETLIYYMGYPQAAQARPHSVLGNAQGVALWRDGDTQATKLGEVLPPAPLAGHWAGGWVGGLQLLPGQMVNSSHRWIAVLNASPTAPVAGTTEVFREEPPPSLGGFAWCDEEFPTRNWQFAPDPIEWIEDVPQSALDNGEGFNLWRQHLLLLPDGRLGLFYNSGFYGREQLYLQTTDVAARGSGRNNPRPDAA